MVSPATHMKDILVSAGVGVFATNMFVSKMPDKPDACIALYDSGGENPNPAWRLDFPSVQIRVRGDENGYESLYTKVTDIKNALLGYPGADVTGGRLVSVRMVGGPAFLGYDDNKRPQFSINWTLIFEPTSGTYRASL